ncbi:MAG TPA: GNAT family N-acetyltransferase [Chloroflexia bacterium]|nr:GNAT family N-acetyltransferase [Chloroflexia bacterium]
MRQGNEHQPAIRYSTRSMSEADIPAVVDFINELEQLEPMGESITHAEYEQEYHRPDSQNFTRLLVTLLDADGNEARIIGRGLVYKSPSADHAFSRLHIHPNYRNQGIGTRLYEELEKIVAGTGAREWQFGFNELATCTRAFLTQRGFGLGYLSLDMRLAADQEVPEPQLPAGIDVRTFVAGQDEELLRQVYNTSFAGYQDHVESPLEEIIYWTQLPEFSAWDGIFIAFAGEEAVASCWTRINLEENKRLGLDVGWIDSLGVVPAYRERGLGRALLLLGIRHLRRHVPIVDLNVIAKNEKALGLYEGVGFRRYKGHVNMVKSL